MTANDQIACPECGYGWNEFTHGFHYTHCSKVAHLNRETTKTEVWTFCARDQHEYCTGEVQLTRTGPPSRCACNCHENDAPAAPERSDRNNEQVRALAANWNQKSRMEQIIARHQMYDLSGLPNREYTASWEDVKLLIEQHSTLITQRERLRLALAGLSRRHPYCWCGTWVGGEHEAECLAAQEAMKAITTSEQEGRR